MAMPRMQSRPENRTIEFSLNPEDYTEIGQLKRELKEVSRKFKIAHEALNRVAKWDMPSRCEDVSAFAAYKTWEAMQSKDEIMILDYEWREIDEDAKRAEQKAKEVLKKGDRVRCTKCPGTKRTFTFDHWDGCWMVSKSGINDYHPANVDRVNGKDVRF